MSLSAVAMGLGSGLGMSKVDHGEDHGFGFGEGSNFSTRAGTIRVMGSRVGGTCTPLGTGRANWVCSTWVVLAVGCRVGQ